MSRFLVVLAVLQALPPPGSAQTPEVFPIFGPDGEVREIRLEEVDGGLLAFRASELATLGWSVVAQGEAWTFRHPELGRIEVAGSNPFFRWDGEIQQFAAEPVVVDGFLYVPVQFVTDFLPARASRVFRRTPGGWGLAVDDPAAWPPDAWNDGAQGRRPERTEGLPPDVPASDGPPDTSAPDALAPAGASRADGVRVVVIDPGHGGRDLGALGPTGAREKDVALAIGRALAEELGRYDGIEVHLTRDRDVLVPLWERGSWATERKGERPGLFVSLHADALPSDPDARGFSTYFLSEARTEHERRVAANENAPLAAESAGTPGSADDLDFILKELRNLDHQHWSALLAERIQERVGEVHPSRDRGVKQGPFAVITNALMPAVLFETGYISNREEERALTDPGFQRSVASALALAIVDFFERYPPESAPGSGRSSDPPSLEGRSGPGGAVGHRSEAERGSG